MDNQALISYINVYHSQLDIIYVDKFWSSINNKQWIYADDILIEWIGYKKDNGKFKYTNLIRENFKENEDYKTYNYEEINKVFHSPLRENENNKEILVFKDKLKEIHNRTIHLILSPKCFKKSLMMIRTEKANSIRDYYVDIEEVCLEFNKFLLEESKMSLETKNKELEEEKNKHINLQNNIRNYTLLEKENYLYVVTTHYYALHDNFKIGKATDLKKRLSQYNTGKNKNDQYYYCFLFKCYNAKSLEVVIKDVLKNYRNSSSTELYVINFISLIKIIKNICENYEKSINFYNDYIISEFKLDCNKKYIPKDNIEIYNYNISDDQLINDINKDIFNNIKNNKKIKEEYIPREIKNLPIKETQKVEFANRTQFTSNLNMNYLKDDFLKENDLIKSEILYYGEHEYYTIKKRNPDYNNKYKNREYQIDFFICNKCFHNFKKKSDLNAHFKRQSECDKILKIKFGNDKIIELYNEKEYYYYYDIPNDTILYACNKCNIKFPHKCSVYKHLLRKNDCLITKYYNKETIKLNNNNPIIEKYKGWNFYRFWNKRDDNVYFICKCCDVKFDTHSSLLQHINYKIKN
jgi:hypothetical protein